MPRESLLSPLGVRGTVLALALGATLVGGLLAALTIDGDDSGTTSAAQPSATPGPTSSAAPQENRFPVRATGRGHGYARVIPCYVLTPDAIAARVGRPMGLGQRAAGSEGDELTGFAREDCYWFSTRPTGPWVVVGSLTTTQLHDRGLDDWTARRYFLERPERPSVRRTYLPGAGDSAYRYGPASAAVLVGDVYLDVTVVGARGDAGTATRRIARALGQLRITGP